MPRKRRSVTREASAWDHPDDRVDTVLWDSKHVRRCCAAKKWTDPPRRCNKPAMRHKKVCREHGGASTGAPMKHGRYSQRLGPLSAAYAQLMEERDLKALEPGLAAMDAWIEYQTDLAARGDGIEFRDDARELFEQLRSAIAGGDVVSVRSALDALGKHLRDGAKQLRTLTRAMETVSRRQHHAERAREIDLRSDQVINARALLAFLNGIVEIVRRELPNDHERVLSRITDQIMAAGSGIGLPIDQQS